MSKAATEERSISQRFRDRVAESRWGMKPDERMRLMEDTFVHPRPRWKFNFALMMLMSVLVAIMGLSANSPAVVIGAMLIAPLMTPVLGVAASTSLALGEAFIRTSATVLSAASGAILLAYVVAGFLPGTLLTAEVMARTAPDARDLVVALAAGIAGSYATARPDVSGSLPGVAVAVALVPPLAVVGVTARAGEWTLSLGALLLFGTNLVAITAVATVVFILAGFVPPRRLLTTAPRVLAGAAVGLLFVGVLGVTLFGRSVRSAEAARDNAEIRVAVDRWISTTLDEAEVSVSGKTVKIRVIGSEQPPSTAELQTEVDRIIGEKADLEVSWIQGFSNKAIEVTAAAATAIETTQVVPETVNEWLDAEPNSDLADFTIDSIEANRNLITVAVSSTVNLPERADLVKRLKDKIGVVPNIQVDWTDLSAVAAERGRQSIDQTEAKVTTAVEEWGRENGVALAEVVFDGVRLRVDLQGSEAPNGADLEARLREIVGEQPSINVGFMQRQSVIPAPTPTPSPTPTVTPTPLPTATPSIAELRGLRPQSSRTDGRASPTDSLTPTPTITPES